MRISKRFFKSLFCSTAWWAGLAISLALSLLTAESVDESNETHFSYQANNAELAIKARVQSYIDVLRGVSALFYTSDRISREQFHVYVEKLNIAQSFPGIKSLNFAPRVLAKDKNAFEAAVRKDTSIDPQGYPDFAIRPAGDRSEYHVLTYLEPMVSNRSVLGSDMWALPAVAKALAASRDTGQVTSSGKLIQINGPYHHIGLAMRMPVYRRGMPLDSVEQRRAAYYGSVGAGFDVRMLMLGAIDKSTMNYLRVRLYDIGRNDENQASGTTDPAHLLFDSAAPTGDKHILPPSLTGNIFVKRVVMPVGPRIWEAEFTANKSQMADGYDPYLPWLMLASGLTSTILLYSIYYSLMTARRRAVELAQEMTKDLRNSEASLAEAQHMAHLGSWVLEPGSGKMNWSAETYRIFGVDRLLDEPHYEFFLRHIHAEDRHKVRAGLDHSIITGEEFTLEHRITLVDGTVRWVQTISRLGHDDRNMLLRGTIMDVSERKHTVEALQRSRELLRELTAHQDRVKEDERKRIAREIHDELGQTLLALRIDVSMLDARTGKTHPRLNEKVRGALNHLDATVKTIRTIINNLRPAVLDLGLTAAIEWQVAEFRRRTGIACDLIIGDKEFVVDDTRATSLFRILQESLTNVIRHANATRVLIELYQEDNRLAMTIMDNGVGIYPESRKTANSFGLVGVEERINALNGEFRIQSAPGRGTTLTIYIPLETEDETLDSARVLNSVE
ncbi:CHASE domain-containing protein [Noviherbaspirillum sp.]|uniref:CHASE domain-containing protein n=1 Tax=Noviherbaspirillum sp. TaxID=1926288 RepID=UPI002B4A6284|nr:CHASE domain-containing protein [Noviherbaspirillum sp.]HJV79554.1 CHASE domain-containing protein [Noviherbaspirillum sp.]